MQERARLVVNLHDGTERDERNFKRIAMIERAAAIVPLARVFCGGIGSAVCDTATEYRLLTLPWRFLFRPRIPLSKRKKSTQKAIAIHGQREGEEMVGGYIGGVQCG